MLTKRVRVRGCVLFAVKVGGVKQGRPSVVIFLCVAKFQQEKKVLDFFSSGEFRQKYVFLKKKRKNDTHNPGTPGKKTKNSPTHTESNSACFLVWGSCKYGKPFFIFFTKKIFSLLSSLYM